MKHESNIARKMIRENRAEIAEQQERKPSDTERLNWYECNPYRVQIIGTRWYSRSGYKMPLSKRIDLRSAIDAEMKETP